ncbi:SET and MYND domain-containing protein 4-like [Macrosteles quadrilineatus]|uniref:SET and MYND domain-containing protein 4-like n=1 Tax=Macrosteles quadrilineatus TaxID=74068 RepID=UPI0023E16503|nr:SET and MYND domain-containing protein 4-like [Macrosteles quadrilineatus]
METNTSFDDKFKLLQKYIKENYSVEQYSEMFSSLKNNHEKVGMAYYLFSEANLLPHGLENHPKSPKESLAFREKGNKEFLLKQDLLAVQTYSVSAAFAPIGSEELALAYANRSAVTLSLNEFETCLEDIDRALAGKYPEHLKFKLYERKGKCLKSIGKNKLAAEMFQLALKSLSCSNLSEEKLISTTSAFKNLLNSCSANSYRDKSEKECPPCFSESRNEMILSASSLVQIEYSQELGRHLVATSDIEPGDVLVIEKPFASVLLPSSYNNYCFHCKKRCHSLIPCLYCVVAMFCSETCRSDSWDSDHRIECGLVPLLVALDFTKIELISLRTLMRATSQGKSLIELMESISETDAAKDPKLKGLDDRGQYNSANYKTVHHLVGNLELRSNADIFRRAATAAYILHLLEKNTDYFSSIDNTAIGERVENNLPYSAKLFVGGLLFRYLMIVPSNAHEVSEMVMRKREGEMVCESVEVGGGLFPVLSLINHSCDPNVVRHSHQGDLTVLTAIQAIPSGHQIFDNYGYHHAMHDVQTRQSSLWSQYHFSCVCQACQEDWPIYSQLPDSNPTYILPSLKDDVEKSSEIFQDVVRDIKSGEMDGKLAFLYAHLALLHRSVKRPWKEYSVCQEAIKQCLSSKANHYMAP